MKSKENLDNNKRKFIKKTVVGFVLGAMLVNSILPMNVNATNTNADIQNRTQVAGNSLKDENNGIAEINKLLYLSKEKKNEFINELKGKNKDEISKIVQRAKERYVVEIKEKNKEEIRKLRELLSDVVKYPELENIEDYKWQKYIWEGDSKTEGSKKLSVANIDYYEKSELSLGVNDIDKLVKFYEDFKYYQTHTLIEIKTRQIAQYRKQYPNTKEIEDIFNAKLKQTKDENYATLEGDKLEAYYTGEFLEAFHKIKDIVDKEEAKKDEKPDKPSNPQAAPKPSNPQVPKKPSNPETPKKPDNKKVIPWTTLTPAKANKKEVPAATLTPAKTNKVEKKESKIVNPKTGDFGVLAPAISILGSLALIIVLRKKKI